MEWFRSVVLPIIIAAIPCIFTFLGIRAQIKADLKKSRQQLDEQSDKNQKEILAAITEHNKQQDESLKCLLRTEILHAYFKHKDHHNETLTQWESENLHKLYESYQALDGNSFVKDVVDRMNSWEIVKN